MKRGNVGSDWPHSGQHYDPFEIGFHVVKYSGDEAIVNCPFHSDQHPSASFNIVSGLFYCFGCGKSSNAKRLAKHMGGRVKMTFIPAAQRRDNSEEWRKLLELPLAVDHPYLDGRRVDNAAVERHNIRASSSHIVIPTYDVERNPVGVVLRNLSPNGVRYLTFGKKPSLWPLWKLNDTSLGTKVFLVEGIFGSLRAESGGVTAFASLGAMAKTEIRKLLSGLSVLVFFDADPAGYMGAGRVLASLPSARAVVPGAEVDELDPDDWAAIGKSVYTTRDMTVLARLSKDPQRFRAMIRSLKWRG